MLSGDNSILQKATDAKQTSERAEAKEQAQMDIMAYIANKTANHQNVSLDDEKVKEILSDNKPYVKEAGDTSFTTKKGEYVIPYSELYTASDTPQTATLPTGTYTAGQEVTVGGEKFFVLEDLGSTVKLLAKYCLNRTGTAQTDASATYDGKNSTISYGRGFSKTNYWSSAFSGNPFDLQSNAMITAAQDDGDLENGLQNAVLTAQSYGVLKGCSGRLMTYEEASTIKSNGTDLMKKIFYGKWTDSDGISGAPTDGFLRYWLGHAMFSGNEPVNESATQPPEVYNVLGDYYGVGNIYKNLYSNDNWCGVRPVLTISKS